MLVERYQKLVYTLALRMLNVPADAEDAAQEAFLSAWKALPRFRMDAKFSTWLYRLTVNAATDVLRRRRKEPDSLDDAERPVQAADTTDTPEEAASARGTTGDGAPCHRRAFRKPPPDPAAAGGHRPEL